MRLYDRPKFRVRFHLADDTRPEFLLYADNAEHAIRKAAKNLPGDIEVLDSSAQEVPK